ncbi:P-loop NTPase fold protein [Erysipelothrix urinaevulpis]|uniref:P-loop NTPase fold protein n=1 Tax=Erysipelothrix urinaevulpis TaxID=2683717 RepID=UPI00135A527C|nr:P-loop NTPase fold protein [Erysipelothrix urinaevulpis]
MLQNNKWKKIYKPVALSREETIAVIDHGNDYLFKDQLIKMVELTNENDNEHHTNIIGVVGERGSGKSSLLQTYKNYVHDQKGNYVLDIIDPNEVEGDLSIIVYYLTQIYSLVKKEFNRLGSSCNLSEIVYNLEELVGMLHDAKNKRLFDDRNVPNIDLLDEFEKKMSFDKMLKKLTEDVIRELSKLSNYKEIKRFVLIVDDIDLTGNKSVKHIFDDVIKYLSGCATIVLSFRDSQLQNAIVNGLIEDNDRLLNKKIINTEELRTQAKNMVDKAIPQSKKVYLPTSNDFLEAQIKSIFEDLDLVLENWSSLNTETNVFDTIFRELFYRTNLDIKPIDTRENERLFMPSNLRGLLQLCEFIDRSLKYEVESNETNAERYYKNLLIFKSYFVDKLEKEMNTEEILFFRNWMNAPVQLKNHIAFSYLYYNAIESVKDNYGEDVVSYPRNLGAEPHNICLGDVVQSMEDYKKINTMGSDKSNPGYFIYNFKVLYSIEFSLLTSSILHDIQVRKIDLSTLNTHLDSDVNFNDYLELMNGLIIPENYNFYSYSRSDEVAVVRLRDLDGFSFERQNFKPSYFTYSGFSITSDVSKNINETGNGLKYRHYFEYRNDSIENVRENTLYRTNPFAYLSNKSYIVDAIRNQIDPDNGPEGGSFLLFSNMFTIDFLIRKSLHRRSENNPVTYTLNRLTKGIFSEYSSMIKEGKIIRHFGIKDIHLIKQFTDSFKEPKMYENNVIQNKMRVYYPPYTEKDIKEIEKNNIINLSKSMKINNAKNKIYNFDNKDEVNLNNKNINDVQEYINFLKQFQDYLINQNATTNEVELLIDKLKRNRRKTIKEDERRQIEIIYNKYEEKE